MTKCTTTNIKFSSLRRHRIEANFKGGDITSNGGILLLREIDKRLKLTTKITKCFTETRDTTRIQHTNLEMIRQRVYGIALGYEDLNDHDNLRHDLAFQTALDEFGVLASSPTLCRFENRVERNTCVEIHKLLLEQFINSFKCPPKELILDFDASSDPIYGHQEGRAFHGYYREYCFLPLHVFCGSQLLVSYLRPSNQDQAKHAWAILSLLVKHLRKQWPDVKIIFRADGGFCRHKIFNWCEKNAVDYIVGLASNQRLTEKAKPLIEKISFEEEKQFFFSFSYGAQTWKHERKVVMKIEQTKKGENRRFLVTSLDKDPKELYKNGYCPRGDMENRIKEQFLLFSDRTSCHKWWPNQLRLLFSSLAYVLVENLRFLIQATEFGKMQVNTLRLYLLKIGGVVIRNTRRILLLLSSSFPKQDIFINLVNQLTSG